MPRFRPVKPALAQARGPSRAAIIAGLFAIALGLRGLNVWRPVDGSIWNATREANTAAIARNFHREGMNILYPRIDWRGGGPGYVETALPLPSYLGAALYNGFGYHEQYLRLVSLAAAVLGCYVFWRLADRVLPPWPAVIAFGFFAFQPVLVASASWIQPETLVLLVYILAIDQFDRWTDAGGRHRYFVVWLATTLAILMQLPTAHLGVLFALMAFRKSGLQAVRRIDLWMLAVLCAVPALLWYAHARSLWLEYGNSIGLSCEGYLRVFSLHFLSTLPLVVLGLVAIEAAFVWTPPGLLFAVAALRRVVRAPEPSQQHSVDKRAAVRWLIIEWGIALVAYYLATGRTTGELDGYYGHMVSVPLVALVVGLGSQSLFSAVAARPYDLAVSRATMHQMWLAAAVIAAAYALLGWAVHDLVGDSWLALAVVAMLGLIGGIVLGYLDRFSRGRSPAARSRRFRVWLTGLLMAAALTAGWDVAEIHRYFQGRPEVFSKYEAALQFEPLLQRAGRIAITADPNRDAYGLPQVSHAPYYFYWLDKKGFPVDAEAMNIETLERLRARGVRFYLAERDALDQNVPAAAAIRRRYRVVEDHPQAVLFELTSEEETPDTADES